MPKYDLTIWVTTTTRKNVEVEAADWEEAEETGRMIYMSEDASTWECEGQDFEVEVDEGYTPATNVSETEIIDRMREARWHDDQPPRD